MDVAAEVRAEAARQSVTVTALAERAGMSVKTCSRKLHGRSRITTGDLWRFGDALGVSAATLMARAEQSDRVFARDVVTNRHRGSLAADVAALREHATGQGVA